MCIAGESPCSTDGMREVRHLTRFVIKLDLRSSLKDGSTISLVIKEYRIHVSGVKIITTRLTGSKI